MESVCLSTVLPMYGGGPYKPNLERRSLNLFQTVLNLLRANPNWPKEYSNPPSKSSPIRIVTCCSD